MISSRSDDAVILSEEMLRKRGSAPAIDQHKRKAVTPDVPRSHTTQYLRPVPLDLDPPLKKDPLSPLPMKRSSSATMTPPTKSPPTVRATLGMATPTTADDFNQSDDTPITFMADEAHSPQSQSPQQNRNEPARKESVEESSTTRDTPDEDAATDDIPDEGVAPGDVPVRGVTPGDVPVVGVFDREMKQRCSVRFCQQLLSKLFTLVHW